MKPRPWLAKERDWLRGVWGRLSAKEIARQLNRTVPAIWAAKRKYLGVCRRQPRLDRRAAEIRRLHAQGCTGGEIRRRLGLSGSAVNLWLHRHGLRPHGCDPGVRGAAVRRELQRRQIAENWNVTSARVEIRRAEAAALGYPQANTPREAKILLLLESGPLSLRQIAAGLGARYTPNMKDTTERLQLRGLIVRRRPVAGDGRVWMYQLAKGVRRGGGEECA